MDTTVENPFLKDIPVVLKKSIPTTYLIDGYSDFLDIRYLFNGIEEISQYECQKTGFKFFHPFEIAGDSKFYEVFQKYDWYYLPWKWENEYCQKYIQNGNHILDVGCGQGFFLKKLGESNKSLTCVGLELNETASYTKDNVKVLNESIEDFSNRHREQFDIVCSFQVLEHIPQVYSFLEGKVKALKKGGKMMIAVPNNNSDFLKIQKDVYFNMPPHHMGHWDEKSLLQIAEIFDLTLIESASEPLQKQHYITYWYNSLRAKYGMFVAKVGMRIIRTFGLTFLVENQLEKKAQGISGHTILVVFKKN